MPVTDESQFSADLAGDGGSDMETSGAPCPADAPLCPWSDLPLGYRAGREMNQEVGAWHHQSSACWNKTHRHYSQDKVCPGLSFPVW